MIDLKNLEVWFITGSQHLYGEETLKQVAEHAQDIVNGMNTSKRIPFPVVFKPIVKTPEEIVAAVKEANASKICIGIITWMLPFLLLLQAPMCLQRLPVPAASTS